MDNSKQFLFKIAPAFFLLLCASCDSPSAPLVDTGAKERPVNVPDDVLRVLDGKLGLHEGQASGTIYNGSEWVLVDIDVVVTVTKSAEERKFRLPFVEKKSNENRKIGSSSPFYIYPELPLKPFLSGEVLGNSGDFADGLKKDEFSWGIASARGYKP